MKSLQVLVALVAIAVIATPVANAFAGPAEDIRDIRGPVPIPVESDGFPYGWALLGVALLGAAAFVYVRRARRHAALTADELARRRIGHARRVMHPASSKLFARVVSRAVRAYLEDRFAVPTTTRTTEEFLANLREEAPPDLAPYRDALERFMMACDLAKYGGFQLSQDTLEHVRESALALVDATCAQPVRAPAARPIKGAPA